MLNSNMITAQTGVCIIQLLSLFLAQKNIWLDFPVEKLFLVGDICCKTQQLAIWINIDKHMDTHILKYTNPLVE